MRGLLILYLIDTTTGGLGWEPESASRLYGWFTGLVYLTPVLGGMLALLVPTLRRLAGPT